MPTPLRSQSISHDEALAIAGRQAFPAPTSGGELGAIGLEQEYLPIRLDGSGRPHGRVPLVGTSGSVPLLDQLASRNGLFRADHKRPFGPWRFIVDNGGQITFEPGGQIEHSTTVHRSVHAALDDLDRIQRRMGSVMAREGRVLAAAGMDLWHELDSLPLQLASGRYLAMATYFDQIGPWGQVMMRHSASLQINLDLGPEGVWQERWWLANLLAPLVLASFAASPSEGLVSCRGRSWQELDSTRTGFPRLLLKSLNDDPRQQWAEAALAAGVLLFRPQSGAWRRGEPGFSFADWIRQGHPEIGWPTVEDLEYHLTTLFFEVRPRGFLELRSCDGLPAPWRAAPAVLITALLYDSSARHQALGTLEPTGTHLVELWQRAATSGIHDQELRLSASTIWELALNAARRMPQSYFGDGALHTAAAYLERFVSQGRMPADELREIHGDPACSLAWASGGRVSAAQISNPCWREDHIPTPTTATRCRCA